MSNTLYFDSQGTIWRYVVDRDIWQWWFTGECRWVGDFPPPGRDDLQPLPLS